MLILLATQSPVQKEMRRGLLIMLFSLSWVFLSQTKAQENRTVAHHTTDSLLEQARSIGSRNIPAALQLTQQALQEAERHQIVSLKFQALFILGDIYTNSGFHTKALEELHKALAIATEKEWPDRKAEILNNIGNVYFYEDSLTRALEYYEQALLMNRQVGNQTGITNNLGNIGLINSKLKKYSKAEYYIRRSLILSEEQNSPKVVCNNLINLADMHSDQAHLDSALHYYHRALVLAKDIRYLRGEMYVYMGISRVHQKRKEIGPAEEILLRALAISQQTGANIENKRILMLLSELEQAKGNFKQALLYYQQFSLLNDSLYRLSQRTTQEHLHNLMEAEHNISENRVLRANVEARENELKASLATQQKQVAITLAASLGLLLLIILIMVLYYHYSQNKKNHRQLKQMHAAIQEQANELELAYEKIREHNLTLENGIEERTRQLNQQNRQLIQYAFFNAHKVRGPLARILGLVNLLPKAAHPLEAEFIQDRLKDSALELDKVVHEINLILEGKPVNQDN